MRRIVAVLAVLVLMSATWDVVFDASLERRMARMANRIFSWASEQGAHVCVVISVDGADPDGEFFAVSYRVCQ